MNLEYNYLIAFHDTPVNTIATEIFRFTSFDDKWTVKENTLINGIHNPFSVKRNPSTVSHQELIIEFKPISTTQKHVCYYVIKSLEQHDITLRVTGKGEYLRVQMSLKYVDFYRINKLHKTKSTFKLLNDSKFVVTFQFDIDNDQKIFQILPLNGIVKPFHYTLITATFQTKKEGIFTLDVPCLFPHNRPIYLQLFGANSPTIDLKTFEVYKASCLASGIAIAHGQHFHSQYSHYSEICSLTQKYFNFTSENNKVSTIVEMLNNTDECLKIIWDTENEENFVIHPTVMSLRPKEKRFFECKFEPKFKEMLMGSHIYGRAQLYDLESSNKQEMVFLRLRLIGNSFEKGKVWNPNLLIPNLVQLPICYTNNTVYTTFIIERTGPYPATYCFIPPAETYFQVKPKVGIIKNSFQIFFVEFSPKNSYDYAYSEDWNIELNGRPEYMTTITFKSFVPEPKILVGNNFTINFGSSFPGATKIMELPVANLSATPLKIKFFKRNKWFNVVNSEKIIDCFDDTNFKFIYNADVDVPQQSVLTLEVYKMHEMGVVDGKSLSFPFTIFADCAFNKLTSIPNYYNFKNVVCGEEYTTKFRIYNFGKSGMNFSLKCYKHFGSAENDPFVINPNKGYLDPEENLDVTVTLCSYESCIGTYCIRYHLLKNESTDALLDDYSSEHETSGLLFKMDYYLYYPTLQIVDIGNNQTGAFYGKKQIWELFQIDKLNNMLQTIKVNETLPILVRLPDAQVARKISKVIVFILKNVTTTDTTCHLKRKKICDCKYQQMEGTFTFRKYSYNCPHKKILNVSLIDNEIKALEITFLEIVAHYKMNNTQNLCYLMHLSHNRTIEITFEIRSLEPGELSTYVLDMMINLKYISIRELSPSVQIYKIVNNTNTHSLYNLQETPIKELNRKAGYSILICLNPIGQVKAKSCEGLMFVFAPISLSKISVDVPIQLGSINYVLHIRGEGTWACKPLVDVVELYAPYKEYYLYPFLCAHISLNELTIHAMSTFNKVTRIFTLRNVSKDKTLAFWFASTYYEDIIHCTVMPSTGLIMPGCCIPLVLTVSSFSIPCTCQTFCSIHMIDQTALSRHFKSNMEFHQEASATNDFFTITDNKIIYYPKPTVQIEPPPNVVHRNITITCKVIASSEMELKVPLRERLKMQPCQELSLYKQFNDGVKSEDERENVDSANNSIFTVDDENDDLIVEDICVPGKCCTPSPDCQFSTVNIIAETVIRDVLASTKFQCKLSSYLSSEPELYYNDFCKQKRLPENDERMMKLALNRIPDSMLSEIMQVLIGNAIIHYFKLGTYPEMEINSKQDERSSRNVNKKLYSEKFAFVLDSSVVNN